MKCLSKKKLHKKRPPELVKELLKANKVKLNYEHAINGLMRLVGLVLILGLMTLILSKEAVNQNTKFAIFTITQGIILAVLAILIRYKRMLELLLPALIIFVLIWVVELLFFGIPNDLYQVYYDQSIRVTPNRIGAQKSVGAARLIGFMYPILYFGVKLFLAVRLLITFRRFQKYESLSESTKEALVDF